MSYDVDKRKAYSAMISRLIRPISQQKNGGNVLYLAAMSRPISPYLALACHVLPYLAPDLP